MKRVMIIGGPGSGKSTLARWLGRETGLPVFHMDLIHWQENWVERPHAEKLPLARAIEARPEWIFEGGLSATYTSRMARADTLIWLDLPVALRLWRVTWRRIENWGKARADMPAGCKEGFNREFLPFYHFIWTSRHKARAQNTHLLRTAHAGQKVHHLRSRAEVAAFQARIRHER